MKRSLPLTRGDCEAGERPCPHEQCKHFIPPVEGDLLRRRAACVLDLAEVAERYGGLQQSDIAWHLGISRVTAGRIERGALERGARMLKKGTTRT